MQGAPAFRVPPGQLERQAVESLQFGQVVGDDAGQGAFEQAGSVFMTAGVEVGERQADMRKGALRTQTPQRAENGFGTPGIAPGGGEKADRRQQPDFFSREQSVLPGSAGSTGLRRAAAFCRIRFVRGRNGSPTPA